MVNNISWRTVFCCFCLSLFSSTALYASTPSHVYLEVETIIGDIASIRQQQGIVKPAREPGVQISKTPLHVYTKGLELFEKIQRFNKKNNWSVATVPDFPQAAVTPANVLLLMQDISSELEKIKQHLGLSEGQSLVLKPGKTPSDVYELVWKASYQMDALVGAIKPSYVYRNTQRIISAIKTIAGEKNIHLSMPQAITSKGKKPIDANIEAFKVLYALIPLEKKLGLKPLRVSSFPSGKITPSDVYDTTNSILSELARMHITLGLPAIKQHSLSANKITPDDVYQQMKLIQALLAQV